MRIYILNIAIWLLKHKNNVLLHRKRTYVLMRPCHMNIWLLLLDYIGGKMAKTKTHSKQDILNKTMKLFWHKGFRGCSMEELVQHTGISRYSIYDNFGSKKLLFLAALEHYFSQYLRPQLSILEGKDATIDEIKAFFARRILYISSPEGRHGCMLCNSAVEMATYDLEISQQLRNYRDYIISLFIRALRNSQAQNKIRKDISLEGVAAHLFITLQGIMVLSKITTSNKLAQKAVHAAILSLYPPDKLAENATSTQPHNLQISVKKQNDIQPHQINEDNVPAVKSQQLTAELAC